MTNLPRNLRKLFGFLRAISLLALFAWPLVLLVNPWIQKHFVDAPKSMHSIGEFAFIARDAPLILAGKPAGSLQMEVSMLRGNGSINLAAVDDRLRWTITLYGLGIIVVTSGWYVLLFGFLRRICLNVEHGDVFTRENVKLMASIGWGLIGYSLISILGAIYFQGAIVTYSLHEQVQLQGAASEWLTFDPLAGELSFGFGENGVFSDILLGALVLLLSRAFQQGLNLKAENDLTV